MNETDQANQFKVGDVLQLAEWNPDEQTFTARGSIYVEVTYIMTNDVAGFVVLPDGWCIMGFRRMAV